MFVANVSGSKSWQWRYAIWGWETIVTIYDAKRLLSCFRISNRVLWDTLKNSMWWTHIQANISRSVFFISVFAAAAAACDPLLVTLPDWTLGQVTTLGLECLRLKLWHGQMSQLRSNWFPLKNGSHCTHVWPPTHYDSLGPGFDI